MLGEVAADWEWGEVAAGWALGEVAADWERGEVAAGWGGRGCRVGSPRVGRWARRLQIGSGGDVSRT